METIVWTIHELRVFTCLSWLVLFCSYSSQYKSGIHETSSYTMTLFLCVFSKEVGVPTIMGQLFSGGGKGTAPTAVSIMDPWKAPVTLSSLPSIHLNNCQEVAISLEPNGRSANHKRVHTHNASRINLQQSRRETTLPFQSTPGSFRASFATVLT